MISDTLLATVVHDHINDPICYILFKVQMPVLVICITKRRRGKDWIEQQSRISSYICPADNSKHVEHDCLFVFFVFFLCRKPSNPPLPIHYRDALFFFLRKNLHASSHFTAGTDSIVGAVGVNTDLIPMSRPQI